jgi:putative acetyltransferase
MAENFDIRESVSDDGPAIEKLYPAAFPEEDLLPLVRQLLREDTGVLSLVAIAGDDHAGHIIFTICGIDDKPDRVALLGPLAVAPARQRQGVGSALIGAGLQRLKGAGISRVYVLGDPAYYGRFGFEPEEAVMPPYPMPVEWQGAWQSLCPQGDTPPLTGTLSVPPPWRQRTLWDA